jgi:hypothetical protein
LEKSLSKLPRCFRPKEIPSDIRYEPVKDITNDEKDSQKETKIEEIMSELQNIRNDMNVLKNLLETALKKNGQKHGSDKIELK